MTAEVCQGGRPPRAVTAGVCPGGGPEDKAGTAEVCRGGGPQPAGAGGFQPFDGGGPSDAADAPGGAAPVGATHLLYVD